MSRLAINEPISSSDEEDHRSAVVNREGGGQRAGLAQPLSGWLHEHPPMLWRPTSYVRVAIEGVRELDGSLRPAPVCGGKVTAAKAR